MEQSTPQKRVLFSLYDQENSVFFAQQLANLGWEIIATKETADILQHENIAARDVALFLGIEDRYPFPPTLHPKMELALTTDCADSIDFVYDVTYPLSVGNDVGGHTLLALAAKGMRIVATTKEDMHQIITELTNNNNEISSSLRQQLVHKAFAKISRHYHTLIKGAFIAEPRKTIPLLEGENPYQKPAMLLHMNDDDSFALGNFEQLSGCSPCFTNMADFDAILQTLCSISNAFMKQYNKMPYIVIAAKHGNPCGLAADWNDPEKAAEQALWGNPLAIWGGELITNFAITDYLSKKLFSSKKRKELFGSPNWMLDVIIAPDFEHEAVSRLGQRQQRKLFKNGSLTSPGLAEQGESYRMVRGGFLRQPFPNYILDLKICSVPFPAPEEEIIDSLIIAWAASWFSNHGGNEVALAKDRKLLGAGGGPATVDSCHTAVLRAHKIGHNLQGAAFAADAFFPFTDGPEALVKAGCRYGVVPGGGNNAPLIKNYFEENNVSVFFLEEQYRGFCRH